MSKALTARRRKTIVDAGDFHVAPIASSHARPRQTPLPVEASLSADESDPSAPASAGAPSSRRDFVALLGTSIGAAWLASVWPTALADAANAREASERGQPAQYRTLSAQQAAAFGAVADRIIPPDDTPGARDAGVVYFADGMLATIALDQKPEFVKALAALDAAARRRHRVANFVSLTPAQQDAVIASVETTDGFRVLRVITVAGYLSHPKYGGNKSGAGWKAIGFEDRMAWQPPFGYYDRPEVMAQLRGRRS